VKILLSAREDDLADAWQRYCGGLANVTICRQSILDVECDAVISPSDGFGFLTSGINMRFWAKFGGDVQTRLQELIRTRHEGELLVGRAEIVSTESPQIPFLIAAPIARVPMRLDGTVHPYLAMRAALLLVRNERFGGGTHAGECIGSRVSSVAVPGLGTGGAGIRPEVCARQVRAAIEEVMFNRPRVHRSLEEAGDWHRRMCE